MTRTPDLLRAESRRFREITEEQLNEAYRMMPASAGRRRGELMAAAHSLRRVLRQLDDVDAISELLDEA